MASDQAYREADIATDFCEDVPRLSEAAVLRIHAMIAAAGLQAKISAIHVNGWFGDYDKLSICALFAVQVLKFDLSQQRNYCLFVGDSPNDAPMFSFFPNSVGVANVAETSSIYCRIHPYTLRKRMAARGLPSWRNGLLAPNRCQKFT